MPLDDIKHVIVLMLENRSFDHLLGALQPELGFDGIDPETPYWLNPYCPISKSIPVRAMNPTCAAVAASRTLESLADWLRGRGGRSETVCRSSCLRLSRVPRNRPAVSDLREFIREIILRGQRFGQDAWT
jgi:Phospholipase C